MLPSRLVPTFPLPPLRPRQLRVQCVPRDPCGRVPRLLRGVWPTQRLRLRASRPWPLLPPRLRLPCPFVPPLLRCTRRSALPLRLPLFFHHTVPGTFSLRFPPAR